MSESQVATRPPVPVAPKRSRMVNINITSTEELKALAQLMFSGGGGKLPNIDRPEQIAAMIMFGDEIGLTPAQSLAGLNMGKNGKVSIGGDTALALVRQSGLLADINEFLEGEGDNYKGVCVVTRLGEPARRFEFSVADANKAGLIKRSHQEKGDGPWIAYLKRMLRYRPLGYAMRDVFPDVLKGLHLTEEVDEVEDAQFTVVSKGTPQLSAATGQPSQTTSTTPAPDQPEPITDAQKKEIAAIRGSFLAARNLATASPEEQRAAWGAVLAAYDVTSATQFSAVQAAKFIAQEGPKHGDPFGHPKSPDSSGATATATATA